jgi:hypothetical protein
MPICPHLITRAMGVLALLASTGAFAQAQTATPAPLFEGYLCCNLRSDGRWISDSNYAESGKYVIPAGTPVAVLAYGRYRVDIDFGPTTAQSASHASGKQALGNDYSRDLAMPTFARRYVVAQNPADKLASYPPKVQTAITSARVAKGMTREQVLMALGYPITSETPHLDANMWRYWLWSFSEFKVFFNEQGEVSGVQTDSDTRARVVMP